MAAKLTSETRRLYSWWWDSHISPKNSKWLQENLTDLDSKVKAMIKIINEDADSFARRAEMYYKKRPELMKLVEEFYRAYRALAERYDHATGELRLAHRTMIEAFPNQVPFMLSDDPSSPVASHLEGMFDPDDLNKASDVGFSKKGFKQLNEIFKSGEAVLRELKSAEGRLRGDIQGDEDRNHSLDLRSMILNESAKVEAEMQRLKQALAKMEAERDAVLAQYRDTLEKLSAMEKELSSAQADAKEVAKCATEAQSEVNSLKESLKKVEIESLDRLRQAEENAERLSEQREQAECEIKAMKEEFSRLNKEKEDAFLRYQECLDMISKLQNELMEAKEEARRLNGDTEDQCALLEEVNQALKLEANDLVQEIAAKDQQLAEKHTELEQLMNRLQDEESQFTQVESALHKLQDMHSQSQEDQRALATELRDGLRMLKDIELSKRDLELEIRCLREENRSLNDLKEVKENLEANVRRQTERNDLLQQQLEGLYNKYPDLQDENSVHLGRQALESSLSDVKGELESSKEKVKALQESYSALSGEKSALLSQLQIITESMQKLLEKNVLLENSLQSANIQLEGLRMKSRSLEDFCQYLKEERSGLQTERCNLVYRLECVEKKLEKLETRFTRLEDKYAGLEKERDSTRSQVDKLMISLVAETKDSEEQLERAVSAQVEIFVLRKFLKDMEERNCSLLEAEKYSERLIAELESENMMQHLEIEYLVERVDKLKSGICQMLEAVEIDDVNKTDPEMLLPRARGSIKDMRRNLAESKDESQELLIQNSVLSAVITEQFFTLNEENRLLQDKLSHLENETRGVRRKMAMKENENIELYLCNEELNQQCLVERERLNRKEEELLEAERRIKAIEDVNTELNTTIEGLQVQCNDLDDKIFELSKCREHQDKEIGLLQEANVSLENEVGVLCREIEECRIREVVLNSELHEIGSEFELWEAEATSFYFDLQMSSVREALLENKVQELSGLCEGLEGSGARKSMEIESLKSRINFLESEKEELKTKLDAYVPAISSLKDNIESLEQSPALQTKLHWPATTNQPVTELMVQESRSRPADARELRASMPDGLTELQDLQSRVKAIETSVEDRLQAEIKLEAATKEIKEPKSRNNSLPNAINHVLERKDGNLHSRSRDGSTHMKDIPLDYISDASPSSHRRRKSSRLSDQLLGLWEAPPPPRNPEIEKELGVDKLEVPKQGGSRKAILERLASDAEKLASLQASVQELRRKTEINKRSTEYRRLKGQLHDVESSMVQLVSVNTELTKTVKESAVVEVEQALRRKMLEQSRRDSERIGSLQLEMQKIQSVMVKLEEEKNSIKKGGRSGLSRIRTGFILREFVYGRSRSRKQKKSRFCGCFRPSHKQV